MSKNDVNIDNAAAVIVKMPIDEIGKLGDSDIGQFITTWYDEQPYRSENSFDNAVMQQLFKLRQKMALKNELKKNFPKEILEWSNSNKLYYEDTQTS